MIDTMFLLWMLSTVHLYCPHLGRPRIWLAQSTTVRSFCFWPSSDCVTSTTSRRLPVKDSSSFWRTCPS
uniref:Putative secreted protein n=1 Tax=Ixodes ricinus TaxID=34613 RepID=A0A6B0U1Y2_IXORI